MAFPTTSVLDSLQGAGLSASFTTPAFGQTQNVTADAQGAFSNGGGTGGAYWNPATFGANQEVYLTFAIATSLLALFARITNPGGSSAPSLNGYQLNVVQGGTWALYKQVSGAATQINSGAVAAFSAGDSAGLEANGTSISFYTKRGAGAWTLVAATTDSAVSGSGSIGFLTGNTAIRLSNFGGGTIGGAVANPGFLPLL